MPRWRPKRGQSFGCESWWTFRIFFFFFLLGEGESEAPGRAGHRIFIENPRKGGGKFSRTGGPRSGRVSAANWGILGWGGLNFFFSGPKCPPSEFSANLTSQVVFLVGSPRTEKRPKTGHADDRLYCDWVYDLHAGSGPFFGEKSTSTRNGFKMGLYQGPESGSEGG